MNQQPTQEQHVHVALGKRSYDILIADGLLQNTGAFFTKKYPKRRLAIIADKSIETTHLAQLQESLTNHKINHQVLILEGGEGSKNIKTLEQITNHILSAKIDRNGFLIALGGGVIGDLTGFAASIIRRGINFIQIPTTLLSQVDSSVGGKTGINTEHGKNLLGTFYQPSDVIIDPTVLDTLPRRHLAAGYAEVIKYGLIDDKEMFTWLENSHEAIFSGGTERIEAITRSCRAKARIVSADEREEDSRALLNLGHTFGHALESITGFSDRLLHGEGVAIGMVLAHRFSVKLNLASPDDTMRLEHHLKTIGLPTNINDIPGSPLSETEMFLAIQQDKKIRDGHLVFVLTRGIGEAFIAHDVTANLVQSFLREQCQS